MINRELGTTVVIVTHDIALQNSVDRFVAIRDGRTSSEFIRKTSYVQQLSDLEDLYDRTADTEQSHDEFVVMDASGHIQLPRPYLDRMQLHGRAKLRVTMPDERTIAVEKPEMIPQSDS